LGDLRRRRESARESFDRVIIETTGLADPAPVAQTFFVEDDVASYYLLDAIVTVVDAKHASEQLDEFHEAQEQVGFADRILLSKSDLVDEQELNRLLERLARMNPRAPIKQAHFGRAPIAALLDVRGFSLETVLQIEPDFLGEDHHTHDDSVQSFVFSSAAPFDQEKLQEFFRGAIARWGRDMMRYKGVVYFEGLDQCVILQGVHMLMNSDLGAPFSSEDARQSKLVFIGRNLEKATMMADLAACLAQ
jgi:G3E family GTPase